MIIYSEVQYMYYGVIKLDQFLRVVVIIMVRFHITAVTF